MLNTATSHLPGQLPRVTPWEWPKADLATLEWHWLAALWFSCKRSVDCPSSYFSFSHIYCYNTCFIKIPEPQRKPCSWVCWAGLGCTLTSVLGTGMAGWQAQYNWLNGSFLLACLNSKDWFLILLIRQWTVEKIMLSCIMLSCLWAVNMSCILGVPTIELNMFVLIALL